MEWLASGGSGIAGAGDRAARDETIPPAVTGWRCSRPMASPSRPLVRRGSQQCADAGRPRAPVHADTWLLVDGATPQRNLWAPLLATLLLAIALSDLGLLRKLFRPAKP